jgi:hypothetical protein
VIHCVSALAIEPCFIATSLTIWADELIVGIADGKKRIVS